MLKQSDQFVKIFFSLQKIFYTFNLEVKIFCFFSHLRLLYSRF
ncbi:hypothetical protein D1BOALGB6SA_10676 [Olavius sp. associated proteobacterium Delta 1]|nr:hypothetical protein D1BOALGB6SA_10676 [Olavius sp. associated proteobacterium Delta 1]